MFVALTAAALSSGCRFNAPVQNAQGVRLYQQGQYQAAIERFQKAIASNPENADGYYNLASTYHQLGKMSGRREELDQAERLYNQCLDYNGNHTSAYRALAVLLVEEGRSEEAFRLMEGWAMRSPMLADPKIELARMWQEFGDQENAKQQLLSALSLDPYNARGLAALGNLHEQTGDAAQALANYERSISNGQINPQLASRAASLRAALNGTAPATSAGGTRTVQGGTSPPRY